MKASLLFCIVLGVFTAHLGVLMLLSHLRPQPKLAPRPRDNFSVKAASFTDSHTGEKMIYQEFTVSTRLSPPESAPPPEKPRDRTPAKSLTAAKACHSEATERLRLRPPHPSRRIANPHRQTLDSIDQNEFPLR